MLGKAELAAAVGYAGAILFFTSSLGITGACRSRGRSAGRAIPRGRYCFQPSGVQQMC
jgi:hypothetical protein